MSTFPFGAVLKIESEWSIAEITRALDDVRSLGMNFVVVWPAVYWWEERGATGYPHATGRRILEHAERIGLSVIMELAGQLTALEYAPDFVMKPEFYATNRDGSARRRALPYDYLNFNHPELKSLMKRQFQEAAAAYREYRALYGYDIWNETMFASFDQHTLALFRRWLERKYGSLDRLNAAWERTYTAWPQVEFTEWSWASVMPLVDYRQFQKDNIGMLLGEWRSWIREIDPSRPCIADNIHSMITADAHYERPQDDWAVAGAVDEYGISFYPKNRVPAMEPAWRRQTLAASRAAARDGRFWISELQSHHQSMFNPFTLVRPHELASWSWEAIAEGAKGIIYWKWDPFVKGIQTAGRGLVDARGARTPRAEAAARIAAILHSDEAAFSSWSAARPRVAILYDRLNHDFVKAYTTHYEPVLSSSLYTDSIAGLYAALWERDIPAAFVTPGDLIDAARIDARLLFVTNQIVMDERLAAALTAFASSGGVVVYDGKLGTIDELGRLYRELPGGPLRAALGYRLEEIEPEALAMHVRGWGARFELPGFYERELIGEVERVASPLARFADGRPALLETRVGAGRIIGVQSHVWYGYFKQRDRRVLALVDALDRAYGLRLKRASDRRLHTAALVAPPSFRDAAPGDTARAHGGLAAHEGGPAPTPDAAHGGAPAAARRGEPHGDGARGSGAPDERCGEVLLFAFNYEERPISARIELLDLPDRRYRARDLTAAERARDVRAGNDAALERRDRPPTSLLRTRGGHPSLRVIVPAHGVGIYRIAPAER